MSGGRRTRGNLYSRVHLKTVVKAEEENDNNGVDVCAGCRQQQVVAALMSQPGFHLSSIDYLLEGDTPAPAAAAAAATSNHNDGSFSLLACMLFCFSALLCLMVYTVH